jgi:hypothetical protein
MRSGEKGAQRVRGGRGLVRDLAEARDMAQGPDLLPRLHGMAGRAPSARHRVAEVEIEPHLGSGGRRGQ